MGKAYFLLRTGHRGAVFRPRPYPHPPCVPQYLGNVGYAICKFDLWRSTLSLCLVCLLLGIHRKICLQGRICGRSLCGESLDEVMKWNVHLSTNSFACSSVQPNDICRNLKNVPRFANRSRNEPYEDISY
jgi:hypothetical protein